MKSVLSRPVWEGGQYEGDETERQYVLRLAMQFGANYVDVELEVYILPDKLQFPLQSTLKCFNVKQILSILICFADCS